MNLHRLLAQRQEQGNPVKVGLIGAGKFGSMLLAQLQPGDTILSLDLAHGGHLSHGLKVNFSGLMYNIVAYGVDRQTEQFDYGAIRRLARECKPKLIISGASAGCQIAETRCDASAARSAGLPPAPAP